MLHPRRIFPISAPPSRQRSASCWSRKLPQPLTRTGCSRLVVAGGVACNSGLRHAMQQFSTESGCRVFFPSPALCADNAAMLAVPGDFYLSRGLGAFDTDALPNWPLDQITAELAGTLT